MDTRQDVSAAILEPWLIVAGQLPQITCGLWELTADKERAVAMFSDLDRAQTYLESLPQATDAAPLPPLHYRAVKFTQLELVGVLAHCFQSQILYAVLNPDTSSAPQLFVLRDVLKAAKETLIEQRDTR